MDEEALKRLWSVHHPNEAEWDTMKAEVTYRPVGWLRGGAALSAPSTDLAIPADPSSFQCHEAIGSGGMGVVYRAHQRRLEREVALKTLHGKKQSSEARKLFVAEGQINGRLEHPNIVPIYDLSTTTEGTLCLAMKLVDGRPWQELLESSCEETSAHLQILLQVCNAVAFAHSRGVIHNDLKPANVMVGAFGEVLLVDWGLAVEMHDDAVRPRASIDGACGTPSYMAPELAEGRGEAVGPWTDVYLLGGILYRILSGRPPHDGESFFDLLLDAVLGRIPSLPDSVPSELRTICERALQHEPEQRYQTVAAFQAALGDYLEHRQSLVLSQNALQVLQACSNGPDDKPDEAARPKIYAGFSEAVAGFQQAQQLWPANPHAAEGAARAHREFSLCALAWGDLVLAAAQAAALRPDDPGAAALKVQVAEAHQTRARAQRQRRSLRIGLIAAASLAVCSLLAVLVLMERHVKMVDQSNVKLEDAKGQLAAALRASEKRQQVAIDALNEMSNRLSQRLLFSGGAEARRMAEEILVHAREGWASMLAASPERGSVQERLGRARAIIRLAEIRLTTEGDAERVLADLAQGHRILAALPGRDRQVLSSLCELLQFRAEAQRMLARHSEAEASYRRIIAVCEALPPDLRGLDRFQGTLAHAHGQLATLLASEGRLEAAAEHGDQARKSFAAALRGPSDEASMRRWLEIFACQADWKHAMVLYELGELEQSESLADAGVRRARQLVARDNFLQSRHALARALNAQGIVWTARGRAPEAHALQREQIQLMRQLLAGDTASANLRRDLGIALERGAVVGLELELFGEVEATMAELLALRTRLWGQQPTQHEGCWELAVALLLQSQLWRATDRVEAALQPQLQAIELLEVPMRQQPDNLTLLSKMSVCLQQRVEVLLQLGRDDQAADTSQQLVGLLREACRRNPQNTGLRRNLATQLLLLAQLQHAWEQTREALASLDELLALDLSLHADAETVRQQRERVGALLLRQQQLRALGQFDRALGDLGAIEQILAGLESHAPTVLLIHDHAMLLGNRRLTCSAQGDWEPAVEAGRLELELWQELLPQSASLVRTLASFGIRGTTVELLGLESDPARFALFQLVDASRGICQLLLETQQIGEALRLLELRQSWLEELADLGTPPALQRERAWNLQQRAYLTAGSGALAQAIPLLEAAQAQLYDIVDQLPGARSDLALLTNDLAAMLRSAKRPAAATSAQRAAVELWLLLVAEKPAEIGVRVRLAEARLRSAEDLLWAGDPEGAGAELDTAMAELEGALPEELQAVRAALELARQELLP